MSLVLLNNGKSSFLNGINATFGSTFRIRLFQNNYTPIATTVIADFTEANFSGYASQLMGSGTVSGPDGSNRWVLTFAQRTWTKSGATGNSIYGYWVEQATPTAMWAERFAAAPIDMNTDGNSIVMTPLVTMKSEFSN